VIKRILFLLIACLASFSPISAFANDVWPIKNGTPQLTNFKGTTLSNELFLKHELDLGTLGNASQVLLNGDTLYSFSSTKVYATSLESKAILWEFTPPNQKDIRKIALVNGHIAVLTYDQLYLVKIEGTNKTLLWEKNVGGNEISFDENQIYIYDATTVRALNSLTGDIKWSYSFPSTWEKFHSPISNSGDKVYFVTDNQMEMTRKLYAINKLSGQVLWTFNVDYYSQYPIVLSDRIILATHTEITAYDANTGIFKWKKPLGSTYASTFGDTFSGNQTVVFTRAYTGDLLALNAANGEQKFKVSFAENVSGSLYPDKTTRGPMLVTSNQVIMENNGKLKFFDVTTGNHEHTISIPNVKLRPILITKQYLLATDDKKIYAFAPPADEQYADPDGDVQPEQPPAPDPLQPGQQVYVVKSGDTLWKIANQFGTTVQTIIDINKLDPNAYIWVGQNLTVPEPQQIHTVQSGDTLWKIANKYATTINAIVETNKLDPNAHIWVGQKLVISKAEAEKKVHTVQPGDTLWKISQKYGTTIQAIVDKNHLDPNMYLSVGQQIIIP
jgi:LysM repeat protein/outer membrane protein assembly factor BamB